MGRSGASRIALVAGALVVGSCGRTPLDTPPTPPELALGAIRTCLVAEDGALHCWGSARQQGDDENLGWFFCDPPSPLGPATFGAASRVSVTERLCGSYTCAIAPGGAVRCGYDEKLTPMPSLGPSTDVRASDAFACALGVDGAVRCFGDLPRGGSYEPDAPFLVPGLSNVVAIAAASNGYPGHACALDATGRAWCWGSNLDGQLGDGTPPGTSPGSTTPVAVAAPVRLAAITAGGEHTCAADVAGDAWCWGAVANVDGSWGDESAPTKVSGLPGPVAQIAAGALHTCAVLGDGSVWCWGDDGQGELGDGSFTSSALPVRVKGVSDAIAIGLGFAHTCAVERDRSVWCWGSNAGCYTRAQSGPETGQLGVSGMGRSPLPVRVSW